MTPIIWIVSAFLICFAAPQDTSARMVEGVEFEERVDVRNADLRLHGTGLLRYRIFIRGYVAALYLGESFDEEVDTRSVLADVPRRLEIEYFWSLDAEDFARATHEGIKQSTSAAVHERLRPEIERLNALYRDVRPGDRYALTYLPGIGTELAFNGRPLGVIEGREFAAALFAIWIGERPLDESLRDQLLARNP